MESLSVFGAVAMSLVEKLKHHHSLYESHCNAIQWEELCSLSLKKSGFGSDWTPVINHKSSIDQKTSSGIRISNKSGVISGNTLEFSGSRLGSFPTLKDKLNFLSIPKTDFIFFLARDLKDWENNIKKYYFVVYNSKIFDYHLQSWTEDFFIKGKNKGKIKGWKCTCTKYDAKIVESMSSQLWTKVNLDNLQEIYEINI